jgi:hypothetical protein
LRKAMAAFAAVMVAYSAPATGVTKECNYPGKVSDRQLFDRLGKLIRSREFRCDDVSRARTYEAHQGQMWIVDCKGLEYDVLVYLNERGGVILPRYEDFWVTCP